MAFINPQKPHLTEGHYYKVVFGKNPDKANTYHVQALSFNEVVTRFKNGKPHRDRGSIRGCDAITEISYKEYINGAPQVSNNQAAKSLLDADY